MKCQLPSVKDAASIRWGEGMDLQKFFRDRNEQLLILPLHQIEVSVHFPHSFYIFRRAKGHRSQKSQGAVGRCVLDAQIRSAQQGADPCAGETGGHHPIQPHLVAPPAKLGRIVSFPYCGGGIFRVIQQSIQADMQKPGQLF